MAAPLIDFPWVPWESDQLGSSNALFLPPNKNKAPIFPL